MSSRAGGKLLLVVHHPGNAKVLGQAAAEIGMIAVMAATEAQLREHLTATEPAQAALVDASGFGQGAWPLCGLLYEHGIPFVVMAAARDREAGSRSLQCGAASVLQKPVAKDALLKLLQTLSGQDGTSGRHDFTA